MSIYDKSSLVLIPSGTKTSKVYSQKPTNGDGDFDFTRSTAATRIAANGNIEKETQNLLLQSNQFDTTWIQSNVSVTSGQSGYDGTNDAWLLNKAAAYGANYQTGISATNGGVYTASVYMKAGTQGSGSLRLSTGTGADYRVRFDLTTGAISTASANNGTRIGATATDVGGGWWRVSVTGKTNNTTITINLYAGDTATTSGTILIQDAQLNQGLIAQEVITTTTTALYGGITDNVPRLDYTDSSCPALLLEPQRTNIITQSEYFGDAIWVKGDVTVVDNSITSPDGSVNASKIIPNANNVVHRLQFLGSQTATYSISVYAKAAGYDRLIIAASNLSYSVFNLTTGTESHYASIGVSSRSIESVGNGWYRCTVIGSSDSGASISLIAYNADLPSGNPTFSGDGTSGVYTYGAQVESGSYPTSYIPTYGTSVTRADDLVITSSPSTSYFGQSEGTIFLEFQVKTTTSGSSRIMDLKNASGSNQIYFQQNATSLSAVVFNGSNQFSGSSSLSIGQSYKVAMAYKDSDYALYIDGNEIAAGAGAGLGTLAVDRVDFTIIRALGNTIKQSLVFNSRLSNAELATLTTI